MSGLLRGFGLILLPLCGWLAGDAVQARTALHLAALQRTIELLQRIRQEIQYRRADLQSLYRQLCREGLLPQNPGGTLQQLPAPERFSAAERACFQQARRTAQQQAGLPHRLGLAGGMMLALLFL